MNNKYIILVLLVLLGSLFSCGSNSKSESAIFETSLLITDSGGNETQLFSQGEYIIFTIQMENLTNESQTMFFSSGKQYDILVYDGDDNLIWNRYYEKVFIQSQTELNFHANEIYKSAVIWDQATNEGMQLGSGNYSVYIDSVGPYYIEIE